MVRSVPKKRCCCRRVCGWVFGWGLCRISMSPPSMSCSSIPSPRICRSCTVPNWKQPTAMWPARIICESDWGLRRWADFLAEQRKLSGDVAKNRDQETGRLAPFRFNSKTTVAGVVETCEHKHPWLAPFGSRIYRTLASKLLIRST